jgi:cytochrome c oxidase subunit 3
MSQPAAFLSSAARTDALRPPRLPEFDAPPGSERRLSTRLAEAPRADVSRMGMCVGVAADGVFFATLLGIALTVRSIHPEVFAYGRYFLDARFAVVESSVLLASALFGTLTIRLAAERSRRLTSTLAATIVLALVFLGLSGYEMSGLAERGLLPGSRFTNTEAVWNTPEFRSEHPAAARYAETFRVALLPGKAARPARGVRPALREASVTAPASLTAAGVLGERAIYADVPSEPKNAHVFFGLFFVVTVVHLVHVVGGVIAWGWLLLLASRRSLPFPTPASADAASLYFSLVTLMRVALCPLFYLAQ